MFFRSIWDSWCVYGTIKCWLKTEIERTRLRRLAGVCGIALFTFVCACCSIFLSLLQKYSKTQVLNRNPKWRNKARAVNCCLSCRSLYVLWSFCSTSSLLCDCFWLLSLPSSLSSLSSPSCHRITVVVIIIAGENHDSASYQGIVWHLFGCCLKLFVCACVKW